MAKVTVRTSGGSQKQMTANSIGELREQLRLNATYIATINGDAASDGQSLPENAYVAFSPNVKAGR